MEGEHSLKFKRWSRHWFLCWYTKFWTTILFIVAS